jgi:acetyl-CoA C-acetyltransferase
MTDIVIAGLGQTPVGEHWDISLRELAAKAINAALHDAGGIRPDALFVGNMLAPTISDQAHLGALVADFAGLGGIEAISIEGGGASGGLALRQGYLHVAAGAVDFALVVGVEKMTDETSGGMEAAVAAVIDSDFEAVQGLTPTSQAALLMRRYMHEFEVAHDDFAGFPIVAHANGESNPNAMFRKAISLEGYQRAGAVSDPLNLFDVAPHADGAAAVLIARREVIPPGFHHTQVRISGSSAATDTLALHDRPDPLTFNAARLSVERACRQAGILPQDIDLFELFDAYSIYTALSLEAAGFAEKGKSPQLGLDGRLDLRAGLPIATFGGLKARGNPGGATGVYQVVEAALQLRGEAGANQVPDARLALVQCLGGPASSAVTHVLERLS